MRSRWSRWRLPTKAEVEDDTRAVVERGAQLFWIFTGSFPHLYNYRGQHREAFRSLDFRDQLRVEYCPSARHTLPRPEDQAFVVRQVAEWAEAHWPRRVTLGATSSKPSHAVTG